MDSKEENLTRTYTYDVGGNITAVTTYEYSVGALGNLIDTINYEYDTEWKDKLIGYNGKEITYDNIGNPLTYGTDTSFTWQNGRELKSSSVNGNKVAYTYDSDGMRVSKTVNGVVSKYYYDGDALVYEQRDSKDIFYYYNATGQATGLRYDGVNSYFTYNSRGDIIGLYDGTGALQASYEYNEWGKLVSIKDSQGNEVTDNNHIGVINPLRYRGYYYDTETGLYYLQSRYYSPEWGRFLNADDSEILNYDQDNVLQYNQFAYGLNNPVNMMDSDGNAAWWIVSAAIGAGIDASFYMWNTRGGGFSWSGLGKSALVGALSGLAFDGAGKVVVKSLKLVKNARLAKSALGKITKITRKNIKLPTTTFTPKKLQHEFKHAKDFGIMGNWNKSMPITYQKAIQNSIDSATSIFKSTYKGEQIYVYYNKHTGIGAYTNLQGSYIGGWKLSKEQYIFHSTKGLKIR